jgi:hypothetical protein
MAIRGLGGTAGVATAEGVAVSTGPAVVYGSQVLGFAPLPRIGAAKFILDEDAFLPLRYRLLAWLPNLILVAGVAMLATYRVTGTRLLGWLAFGSGIGSLAIWDLVLGGDWRPAVGYCLWLASMLMLPGYVWACHRLARAE